jgi:hypothetical protein
MRYPLRPEPLKIPFVVPSTPTEVLILPLMTLFPLSRVQNRYTLHWRPKMFPPFTRKSQTEKPGAGPGSKRTGEPCQADDSTPA